jgi:hypothetical protein
MSQTTLSFGTIVTRVGTHRSQIMDASNDKDDRSNVIQASNKEEVLNEIQEPTAPESVSVASAQPMSQSAHNHDPTTSHRLLFNTKAFGLQLDLTVEKELVKSSPLLTPEK